MRSGIACVLTLIAAKASGASPTWLRVSSPSIILFTDSSEKTARAVLNRFETLHRLFDESNIAASSTPLRVFVFSSARDYLEYRTEDAAAAFYQSGDGRDLIVLYEDTALRRNASHEYLHMVIQHASGALPRWLDEGVAEFYSTISIHGTKVSVGETIEPHLSLLARQQWLSAEDLALGNRSDGPAFYAESWALVDMLSLSPEWKNGMPQFVKLLNDGRPQEEAFIAAFGKPMQDALPALRRYLRNPKQTTIPVPFLKKEETYQVTRLTSVDSALALADLALSTRHPDRARSLFLRAAKENPQSPAAVAGLGTLALAENRKDDARRQFEQAIAMGNRDPATYFELAMLTKDDAFLDRALRMDPNFAEANFLLGVHATDRGNLAGAIEHLQHAVAIEPRHFTYWHALGYAQSKAADRQGAAASARRATLVASNAQEEQMAAALTQLALDAAPAIAVKKPAVTTPPSWQNRKGDARAEGTLTWVDCDSAPVRLVVSISTPPRTIELSVLHPGEVELLNAEGISTTLACGEQSRPVAIEYIAATRGITKIEFQHVIIKR